MLVGSETFLNIIRLHHGHATASWTATNRMTKSSNRTGQYMNLLVPSEISHGQVLRAFINFMLYVCPTMGGDMRPPPMVEQAYHMRLIDCTWHLVLHSCYAIHQAIPSRAKEGTAPWPLVCWLHCGLNTAMAVGRVCPPPHGTPPASTRL